MHHPNCQCLPIYHYLPKKVQVPNSRGSAVFYINKQKRYLIGIMPRDPITEIIEGKEKRYIHTTQLR